MRVLVYRCLFKLLDYIHENHICVIRLEKYFDFTGFYKYITTVISIQNCIFAVPSLPSFNFTLKLRACCSSDHVLGMLYFNLQTAQNRATLLSFLFWLKLKEFCFSTYYKFSYAERKARHQNFATATTRQEAAATSCLQSVGLE